MNSDDPDGQVVRDRPRQVLGQMPTFDTADLFGRHREVILVHKGAQYRLRMTQSGKLILTK